MYLKTIKPTYHGSSDSEKLSMLIAYVEELGDEVSFRLENFAKTIAELKKGADGINADS